MSVEERFWQKVQKTESCWSWTAGKTADGYGLLKVERKPTYAHRFSYELHVGPIPQGLTIDHLCRNRACVNPSHLEVVTVRVNNLRGISPSAKAAVATHCTQGHPFDLFNTYVTPRTGKRDCKICRRERSSRTKRKRSALGVADA